MAREVPVNRQDFQLLKSPLKRDMILPWNQAIGTSIALTIFQVRGAIQNIQLGWPQFPWILPTIRHTLFWILVAHDQLDQERQSEGSRNMRCIVVLQQNSVLAISLLCSPTLRQNLVGKVVLFTFRQNHHVLQELMCLRRSTCQSCPPFRRCRTWVLHLSRIQRETRSHVQLLACTLLQSNIPKWDIVLVLTSLAYQPNSRERSARPTKRATFALSQRKSAYPARAQELDDDEDDKPLVRPDRTTVSEEEDEDDIPLVQHASAPKRESAAIRRVPTPLRGRKGPPVWRYPSATLEPDAPGTSRERQKFRW